MLVRDRFDSAENCAEKLQAFIWFGERNLMAVRDLFLPLLNYPNPPLAASIEAVVDLAESLSQGPFNSGAHVQVQTRISALILQIEIGPGLYFEGAHIGEFLEAETKKSIRTAQALDLSFREICMGRHVLPRCRIEKRNSYDGRQLFMEEARLHHITVLPMRKGDVNHQDMAEGLIFESGRPVLVFPELPTQRLAKSFERIAVGWDGSRAAARAIADAMPFLRRAAEVRIFSVSNEKTMPSVSRADEFVQQLVSEGVESIYEQIPMAKGDNIGNFLTKYIADHRSDLLVMGGYGHSRIREFILGGATKSVLANPPGWVLLSH